MGKFMSDKRQKIFDRFARLDTWVVGLQYYDDASDVENEDVVFERDPKNPFDKNAIAVYTVNGVQLGHLPQYDAVYLSPLILQGVVALKGKVGVSTRGDIIPLALEVFATSKISELLVRDISNDWRAIYHNMFIDIWARLPEYSAATLFEFRERFRPLAHKEDLFEKTQFLYRMLKAHISDLEKQEVNALREKIIESFKEFSFGKIMGWPEVTVIPLDEDGSILPKEAVPLNTEETLAVIGRDDSLPDILPFLPVRCPYPVGTRGAIVMVDGEFFSIDWFDSAASAEVYWYQMILVGIRNALGGDVKLKIAVVSIADDVRGEVLELLRFADYKLVNREDNMERIDIENGVAIGHVIYSGNKLVRLSLKREYVVE